MTNEDELKNQLERIVRRLLMQGWKMGKQQVKTPFKYTLDTDAGEKDWKEILTLFTTALDSAREEAVKGHYHTCRNCGDDFWTAHYLDPETDKPVCNLCFAKLIQDTHPNYLASKENKK